MTTTPNKGLTLPGTGDNVDGWGPVLNNNFTIIDAALAGAYSVTLSNSNVILTQQQADNLCIVLTGTVTNTIFIGVPLTRSLYVVFNETSGAFQVFFSTGASGGANLPAPQGRVTVFYCDGSNIQYVSGNYQPSFRMVAPSVNLTSGVDAVVSNYGSSEQRLVDNVVNKSSGIVTIGTFDAGVYNLSATCCGYGPNESIALAIFVNSLEVAQSAFPVANASSPAVISTSVTVGLSPGDRVYAIFRQTSPNGNADSTQPVNWNHLSGFRGSP